ncbi:dolichyldiphosphatase 1 isoform X2 [Ovis aries]|uniref:dolichyldiphosphatase 1 isoform X2 n=1 Tax=Ovis aries TaxID=9940 RepID=UPI001C2DF46F|nr:dolichyldiphosphatase 1 isoform X2 [Ovis aries]
MAADGQCSLPASWRPVTLTHVEYPAGDLSGHVLAYLSLSPVFVIVGFVTLIIFKRELHTVVPGGWEAQSEASRLPRGPTDRTSSRQISFLGGLALNEGVNWLIKHVIQEPRPCGGPHTAVGTKYGMPSSHSQFMWFFSIYSFLFLYLRMHQTNNARFLDLLWRHVLSLGLLTVAFLVSYSRVYLLYHTWGQVLYGGIAGGLMAVAWFVFTQEVLTPLFPRIAAWPVSEFFLIRDTSLIPNVLWFEYTVTRAEASQALLGTGLPLLPSAS